MSNNLEIQLNYFRMSFDIAPNGNLKHSVFNFVIVLAKYYIFGSKYKHQIPNINSFLSLLERTKEFEKYIAFSRDKMDKHICKWNMLRFP